MYVLMCAYMCVCACECVRACFLVCLFCFWRYLTRGLNWHLSENSIRPSIYFSSIVKSRSNPFLERTSTKQNFLPTQTIPQSAENVWKVVGLRCWCSQVMPSAPERVCILNMNCCFLWLEAFELAGITQYIGLMFEVYIEIFQTA